MKYTWEVQRKDLSLWVHRQGIDPAGATASELPPEKFVRDLARRLLVRGEWRVVVWDRPWPGGAPVATATRRTCIGCGEHTVLAYEIDGARRVVDPDPVEGGELVLFGDLGGEPSALWGVAPEGETLPWGLTVPAGAPRYRQHACGLTGRTG